MIPQTLSASSLQVAALCMERWKAEYIDRVPNVSGVAGNIGTACHGGLEKYVDLVYIKKTHEASLKLLVDLYGIAYIETFGSADFETDEFKDGLAMIQRWFKRTDFTGVEVISVEQKVRMPVPVEIQGVKGSIPFTYIIDRLDRLGPGEYRVVDYKTVRVPIQPDDLETKIQARVYALAVQRDHPDAVKIRVVFDLLRHEPVGMVFDKKANIDTAHFLMAEAQRIVDTDESVIEPTLNLECGYCPLKATCPLLQKNLTSGGIHSLTKDQMIQRKHDIESQTKANGYLLEEIDVLLLKEAVDRDELEWDENGWEVAITASKRRNIDSSAVAKIIGPELFSSMGSVTMGNLDKLLADPSIDDDIKNQVKSLIYVKYGDPKPKVKRKKTLV